ncbi:hypothetical protein FGO68_gene6922 [Halteria grandinella]|uniref:Uncharacterized protein n=1 Tax=Halteria grandinella TaxID=5974 RepID=A0A8J8P6E1_HALGN|nr:hypothetical protein FGO68_gene6922 [Halteria grandinella]
MRLQINSSFSHYLAQILSTNSGSLVCSNQFQCLLLAFKIAYLRVKTMRKKGLSQNQVRIQMQPSRDALLKISVLTLRVLSYLI